MCFSDCVINKGPNKNIVRGEGREFQPMDHSLKSPVLNKQQEKLCNLYTETIQKVAVGFVL